MTALALRCSKLPLAFACPGSQRHGGTYGEIRIQTANEYAALGSAIHEVLASVVLSPTLESPDLRVVALKYKVDADELNRLVNYGLHAWRALAQYYPEPVTEQDVEFSTPSFALTGHFDVGSRGADWANILDWKSGYKQPDYYHQLMGYAWLVVSNFPEVTTVRATTVWLRDWSQETLVVTAEDLGKWEESLVARVVHWDGTYTAGAHCQYCPRFSTCPARQALVQSALTEIDASAPGGIVPAAAMPVIVQMYREGKLAVVKGLLTQIEEMIRGYISAVGPIDLGNGRELALVGENRDTIHPLPAWPILSEVLTNEELAPAIKIGKTAILAAVADKAPKGQKAKVKAALMAELEAAGAVSKQTIYKMRERKIEKEIANANA